MLMNLMIRLSLHTPQVDNLRKHVHASGLINRIDLVITSPLSRYYSSYYLLQLETSFLIYKLGIQMDAFTVFVLFYLITQLISVNIFR